MILRKNKVKHNEEVLKKECYIHGGHIEVIDIDLLPRDQQKWKVVPPFILHWQMKSRYELMKGRPIKKEGEKYSQHQSIDQWESKNDMFLLLCFH